MITILAFLLATLDWALCAACAIAVSLTEGSLTCVIKANAPDNVGAPVVADNMRLQAPTPEIPPQTRCTYCPALVVVIEELCHVVLRPQVCAVPRYAEIVRRNHVPIA